MKYFDYAATCPIDEQALQTYMKASREYYGNTSSVHHIGSKAHLLLEHSRKMLASAMKVDPEGIYFTSGGTESNYIGLHALAQSGKGRHIIVSEGEHSSVHNTLRKLEAEGYEVSMAPLTAEGVIDLKKLEGLIRADTGVISIQHINSDIGTIQPIEEISQICNTFGILLHSDCVQSLGKVRMDEVTKYMDSFSVSSHKVYGPKGVGAVYVYPSLSFSPLLPNVAHEGGVRAGTVNAPGIASFIEAVQKSVRALDERQTHIRKLKQFFCGELREMGSRIEFLGSPLANDVPIIGMCIHEIDGQWMMIEGDRKGYAFSTGSACQARSEGPARTLLSMGIPREQAQTFIRISFSYSHTLNDVCELTDCLKKIMKQRIWEEV